MCTAATYRTKDFYFGRTLDNACSYVEEVTVTPRRYRFAGGGGDEFFSRYAMIGMAYVLQKSSRDYPLYYDAVNEKGLCMAGLNFVGSAVYRKAEPGRDNIPQYAFIPWILGQCASVKEAKALLARLNLTDTPFRDSLPAAQLHWLIADREEAVTVEAVKDGLRVYDNPVGVLTNNPPFEQQLFHLNNYMSLSPHTPENRFSKALDLKPYSLGMGALGLPGDLSSQSRFVRCAFVRANSRSKDGEEESVSQFFHILGAVDQQRGCCDAADGGYEITIYTSCCNAQKGIYYYTTYENRQITAVDMHRVDLDGKRLIRYPMRTKGEVFWQN